MTTQRFLTASPAIATEHVDAARTFYTRHFDATLVFDCGWFISLEFGDRLSLQFMQPQEGQVACNPQGLIYNFRVEDVDGEYERLRQGGLAPHGAPEDHPWGDRGFSLTDPCGVMLYIYADRPPSAEFRAAWLGRA